jgi:hypothetical protein
MMQGDGLDALSAALFARTTQVKKCKSCLVVPFYACRRVGLSNAPSKQATLQKLLRSEPNPAHPHHKADAGARLRSTSSRARGVCLTT